MALTDTELLQIAIRSGISLQSKFNALEFKRPATGALDAFFQSTPDLIAGGAATIASVRQSQNKVGKIPVMQKTSRAVGSARACSGTGTDSTALITPTYVLKSQQFYIPVDALSENMIGFDVMLMQHMSESFKTLHQSLDELCLAALETNKSQVNAGTINTFSGSLDRMEVALADKTQYFGTALAELQQNNLTGPYMHVHTLGEMVYQVNAQSAQGVNNATNLNWQFAPFINFGSGNFDIETGTSGGSYFFESGTVGIVPWARNNYREGRISGPDAWFTIEDPIYPITWEIKTQTGCSNQNSYVTANAGHEASYGISYVISAEFATINAYTSNTDTSIYKYVQKTS